MGVWERGCGGEWEKERVMSDRKLLRSHTELAVYQYRNYDDVIGKIVMMIRNPSAWILEKTSMKTHLCSLTPQHSCSRVMYEDHDAFQF
jgi:hypothetical protein